MSQLIAQHRKAWSADTDVRRAVDMADLHRLPVGLAFHPHDDPVFPKTIDVFTLIDIKVGHFRPKTRVVSPARGYTLTADGDVPQTHDKPKPYRNVDWCLPPSDPQETWTLPHASFSRKIVAPRSGKVRKTEDNKWVRYAIHDGNQEFPVCELPVKEREKIRCMKDNRDVVEKGDVLVLLTGEVRGRTGVAPGAPGRENYDCLNVRREPFALQAFVRCSQLMTLWAIFNQQSWEKYHDEIISKCQRLKSRRKSSQRLGTLGSQLIDTIENGPASDKFASMEDVGSWGPRVMARVPLPMSQDPEIVTAEMLVDELRVGASDCPHVLHSDGSLLLRVGQIPESLKQHVTDYCYDLRGMEQYKDAELPLYTLLALRDNWKRFPLRMGDLAFDLRPTDPRYRDKGISKKKMLHSREHRSTRKQKQRKPEPVLAESSSVDQ